MSHRFVVRTPARSCFVDVTPQVGRAVSESGIQSGVCHIYVPHTTAGVVVNEGYDPDVVADALAQIERMVPWDGAYRHDEGNAAAHIKAILVGADVSIPVEGGKLALGTWQAIFLCEFDGPRERELVVTVLGGGR